MSRAGRSEQRDRCGCAEGGRLRAERTSTTIRLNVTGSGRERRLGSMRIGVLTGGGDCPGLNAVIRAVAPALVGGRPRGGRRARRLARDGRRHLFKPLGLERDLRDPAARRHDHRHLAHEPVQARGRRREGVARRFEQLDALVAIGGEDTLGVAAKLYAEFELPVVGVPKTIDNDLSGTDYTFGFDTAVAICTEAIDRLHTTAESHNRVMVVEVMGRHAGWIAVMSGIAGGADVILIPEQPVVLDEVCGRDRAAARDAARTSRSSSSARAASSRARRTRARSTSSATSCSRSAASASSSARRSRAAPASRRA